MNQPQTTCTASQEYQRKVARLEAFLHCYAEFVHALRNSLAVIHGASQLLMSEESNSVRRYAGLIYDETAQMSCLTLDLLELSRLETGQLRLFRSWIDLSSLVNRTVSETIPLAEQHPIEVLWPDTSEGRLLIHVDSSYFGRALRDLLLCSCRRAPEGTPVSILVEYTGMSDEPDRPDELRPAHVTIHIRDCGMKLSEDLLPYLFEPFHDGLSQETLGSKSKFGLSVCKGIVETHGGSIWAQSDSRQGTVFSIRLPAQVSPPSQSVQSE